METSSLIGWLILILSWIVPSFIEDKEKKNLTGLVLSAIATGYFFGLLAERFFNQ